MYPVDLPVTLENPPVGWDDVSSALSDRHGGPLWLGVRDGARSAGIEAPDPSGSDRQKFLVYPDGRIQNVALGSSGFLTRTGPSGTEVRFAELKPDDLSQEWNYKAGPWEPVPADLHRQRYVLVVAPVLPNDKTIGLLTAGGDGKGIVVERRKYPFAPGELDQLARGLCWHFDRHDDPESAQRIMPRWEILTRAHDDNWPVLLGGAGRRTAMCDSPPSPIISTADGSRRAWFCQTQSADHVRDICTSSGLNPACPLNNVVNPWDTCDYIQGTRLVFCTHG